VLFLVCAKCVPWIVRQNPVFSSLFSFAGNCHFVHDCIATLGGPFASRCAWFFFFCLRFFWPLSLPLTQPHTGRAFPPNQVIAFCLRNLLSYRVCWDPIMNQLRKIRICWYRPEEDGPVLPTIPNDDSLRDPTRSI